VPVPDGSHWIFCPALTVGEEDKSRKSKSRQTLSDEDDDD
jgi:hypothetical protein